METLEKTLISWAASRQDDIVMDVRKAYFSFSIVADAFEKGVEMGKSEYIEQARVKYFDKVQVAIQGLNEIIEKLKAKGYSPTKLFFRHNLEQSDIILAIDEQAHYSNEFIEYSYKEVADIEAHALSKDVFLDISFIDDAGINLELLKSDKFDVAIDLSNNNKLY